MRVFPGKFNWAKRPTLNVYEQDAAHSYACDNSNEAINIHSGRVEVVTRPSPKNLLQPWFWRVLQNIGCGRLIKSRKYLVVQLFTTENARVGTSQ